MYTIENTYWKATFNPKGAELKSLRYLPSSKELMWQGNPRFWSKTSPILFPIVGALKDDMYIYKGKTYFLSRHGFARDREFDVRQDNDKRIEFVLKNDNETLSVYPFEFELHILYELSEYGLTCAYQVNNTSSDRSLFFSLGGHPAFAIEANDEISYSDYEVVFPEDGILTVKRLRDNLLTQESELVILEKNRLSLSYPLFYEDVMILENLQSENLMLKNKKNTECLTLEYQGFPYLGLWAARNANFICLEPWAGIADYEEHDQQLVNKKGIINLAPKGVWKAFWGTRFVTNKFEEK